MLAEAVFYLGFGLLTAHELDAVHKREWRLLFVLRRMREPLARDVFVLAHVPLVAGLVWLLASPDAAVRLATALALDGLLVIHAGLHWRLSDHPLYEFRSLSSRLLIYGAAVCGLLHPVLLVLD